MSPQANTYSNIAHMRFSYIDSETGEEDVFNTSVYGDGQPFGEETAYAT